jgi:ribonuclease PH
MARGYRDRPLDEPREHRAEVGYLDHLAGSVLYHAGRTRVLCTAVFEEGVPSFLLGRDQGWTTAEYDLLPASTAPRHPRERGGKLSGRTQEIQRLIGRTIRASLDLSGLAGLTLRLDCDVIQADGGTRSAAVNGSWIAAALAIEERKRNGLLARPVLKRQVAAVSVGVVDGRLHLDLDYQEDSRAAVDLTVAMDTSGGLIEVQGTAEGEPFSDGELSGMIGLARRGLARIFELQRSAVGGV